MAAFLAIGQAAAGQTIIAKNLVYQAGDELYLATNADADRGATSVVVLVSGDNIYHTAYTVITDITITGTPDSAYTIYLGTAGGYTFDRAGSLAQPVGFVSKIKGGDTYDALLNINRNVAIAL